MRTFWLVLLALPLAWVPTPAVSNTALDLSSDLADGSPFSATLAVREAVPFPGLPRVGSAAVYDPVMNRVYVHGGVTAFTDPPRVPYLDEFWFYDLDEGRWEQINEGAIRPGERAFHRLALDPPRRRIVLFGGKAPAQYSSCRADLWAFNLDSGRWELLAPDEPMITFGRQDPIVNVDPRTGNVWVHFGGCDGEWVPSQFFRYDIVLGQWKAFQSGLDVARRRQAGLGAYDLKRDRILITGGGVPGSVYTPESTALWRAVWSFDPLAQEWEELHDGVVSPGMPGFGELRMWAIGAYDDLSDLFVTYGGYDLIPGASSCAEHGCPPNSNLLRFDLTARSWMPTLQADTSWARVHAAGAYCRCTGEMMVFAGSKAAHLVPAFYHRFRSDAFFVEVERKASFKWLTPPQHLSRARHPPKGVLRLVSETASCSLASLPMLVDCSTGDSLQSALAIRELGGSRWRVTFPPLGPRAVDALARNRLILVGQVDGDRIRYLARVESDKDHAGDDRPPDGADEERPSPNLRVERTSAGWVFSLEGAPPEPTRFTIYDVAGRLVFSETVTPTAPVHAIHWNGADHTGARVRSGVYFATVEVAGQRLRTKVLVLAP